MDKDIANDLIVIGPLIGLFVNMLFHIVIVRNFRFSNHIVPLFISFVIGILSQLIITIRLLGALQFDRLDDISLIVLNCVSYCGLAYGYFTVYNLTVTSLRVRIIRLLLNTDSKVNLELLNEKYGSNDVVEARLQRLRSWDQIKVVDNRYQVVDGAIFLRISKIIRKIRSFILGSDKQI